MNSILALASSVIAFLVALAVLAHTRIAELLPPYWHIGFAALAIVLFALNIGSFILTRRSSQGRLTGKMAREGRVQAAAALLRDSVPATASVVVSGRRIKPLSERLIVRPLPDGEASKTGMVIPDSAKEKPNVAEVVAAGHGKVSVGDTVLFEKYSGEAAEGGEDLLILSEDEILEVMSPGAPAPQSPPPLQRPPPPPPPLAQAAPPPAQQDQKAAATPSPDDQELLNWVARAPLAASIPLQPSPVPRLVESTIVPIGPAKTVPADTIRLFYGTDRARKISARGVVGYSWRRGKQVDYGICWVSIPPNKQHVTGRLEGPSWFKLQFNYNPEKHVTLHEIAPVERGLWLEQLGWVGKRVETKQLLLFIHGYNVTFRDAARRTGQFIYDLEFHGVPMFYSWPSCGATLLYTFDEAAVQNAEGRLQTFIEDALSTGDFESVFLVAHSMGNRVMAAAIERVLRKTAALGGRIRHLILAAPDIDAGYFTGTVAPNLLSLGLKMTMYVSSRDRALATSRWFHGWPRVGDAKKGIVVVPGIDTIDASNVDTSFVGHSPFADRRELLTDINSLMKGNAVGNRYGFKKLSVGGATYYSFRK